MNNGVLAAGEGRSIWVVGDRYTIKCSGNDTSGAFAHDGSNRAAWSWTAAAYPQPGG